VTKETKTTLQILRKRVRKMSRKEMETFVQAVWLILFQDPKTLEVDPEHEWDSSTPSDIADYFWKKGMLPENLVSWKQ